MDDDSVKPIQINSYKYTWLTEKQGTGSSILEQTYYKNAMKLMIQNLDVMMVTGRWKIHENGATLQA